MCFAVRPRGAEIAADSVAGLHREPEPSLSHVVAHPPHVVLGADDVRLAGRLPEAGAPATLPAGQRVLLQGISAPVSLPADFCPFQAPVALAAQQFVDVCLHPLLRQHFAATVAVQSMIDLLPAHCQADRH